LNYLIINKFISISAHSSLHQETRSSPYEFSKQPLSPSFSRSRSSLPNAFQSTKTLTDIIPNEYLSLSNFDTITTSDATSFIQDNNTNDMINKQPSQLQPHFNYPIQFANAQMNITNNISRSNSQPELTDSKPINGAYGYLHDSHFFSSYSNSSNSDSSCSVNLFNANNYGLNSMPNDLNNFYYSNNLTNQNQV
jgi:hypothetical protein